MSKYIIEKVVEHVPTTMKAFDTMEEAAAFGDNESGKGGVLVLAELFTDENGNTIEGKRKVHRIW